MKLTFVQRFLTHLSFFVLLFSGLIWLVLDFIDIENDLRFIAVWSLAFHGLAAFIFMVVFGMLFSTHISFNWQVKKNRRISGIILTAILLILMISGYLLYYAGDEDLRHLISFYHWVLGLICSVFFIWHFLAKTKKTKLKTA